MGKSETLENPLRFPWLPGSPAWPLIPRAPKRSMVYFTQRFPSSWPSEGQHCSQRRQSDSWRKEALARTGAGRLAAGPPELCREGGFQLETGISQELGVASRARGNCVWWSQTNGPRREGLWAAHAQASMGLI